MLVLENIHIFYGKVEALRGVSLHVDKGEIVSVIGGNGAGKTTLLKTVTGLLHPAQGRVVFEEKDISKVKPHHITGLGISMVPEGRGIFPELTVEDNLLLGSYSRYYKTDKSELRADLERHLELFPILLERRKQMAGTLSGGEQQMLAVARGLMANPRLLLLDEPSLGLSPMMCKEIFAFIAKLSMQGVTVVLVEQMASYALSISHRAYVLEIGSVVLEGDCKSLIANPEVKKAYLGG